MTIKQIIKICDLFNIRYYNQSDKHIILKGINGQATTLYNNETTHDHIKKHILQMGRDSLKEDLNNLLNVTLHN